MIGEYDVVSNSDSSNFNKRFFTIPNFKKMSEKFKFLTSKFDFNIAYKPMSSMSTFIKTKDKIKKVDHSNVVYKINCQD